jgi:hypothetical protein
VKAKAAYFRNDVGLDGQATVDVRKVGLWDVLRSIKTEALDTKGDDVVEMVDERLPDVVRLGLEIGKAGQLAELDLSRIAPVIC